MKYKIGDRVQFWGNESAAPDEGTVTRIVDLCVWVKWDSDGKEKYIPLEDDSGFEVIDDKPVEITRDVVDMVLRANAIHLGYHPSVVFSEVIDSVYAILLRESDPDYQLYLKLKARFE